jgi:hypothetical protein
MSLSSKQDELLSTLPPEYREIFEEDRKRSRPSPSLVVYCDLHLGSKMRREIVSLLHQYGMDFADCNFMDYWRCPRLDCVRCYTPIGRGYFWFGREPGSRIQMDSSRRQKRCGRHDSTPFMCVSNLGGIRKYICPFYGCNEHGDTVASVPDENPPLIESPFAALTKKQRKQRHEREVFNSFVFTAGIAVDDAHSGEEPYPDIRSTMDGNERAFELGEIVDQKFAERTSPTRRQFDGGFSFSLEQPLLDIISKKLGTTYVTGGVPIELVLYYGKHPADSSAATHIGKHRAALESLVTSGTFSRVWVLDNWTKTILWKSK